MLDDTIRAREVFVLDCRSGTLVSKPPYSATLFGKNILLAHLFLSLHAGDQLRAVVMPGQYP